MKDAIKRLDISESALYRLPSKRKLAEVLLLPLRQLDVLAEDKWYRVRTVRDRKGKPRVVQEPMGRLRRAHDRVQYLFSQLRPGSYLFSGQKGLSPVANARLHVGNGYALQMDVQSYFPSCTQKAVFYLFVKRFRMASDVAFLLSKICTYEGRIPTGSPLSMSLAYWAYRPTFDQIDSLIKHSGGRFSLFVDDMTASSSGKLGKDTATAIEGALKRAGLKVHPDKTEWSTPQRARTITGATRTPNGELKVPNRNRLKIVQMLQAGPIEKLTIKEARSVFGMIESARQIEPTFFEGTRNLLIDLLKKLVAEAAEASGQCKVGQSTRRSKTSGGLRSKTRRRVASRHQRFE